MGLPMDVSSRLLHVLFAVLLLGGAMFTRFVLMPAAAELPDDQHALLKDRLAARWRKLVGMGIGVLLLTGFYNYLVVTRPLHSGDKLYHMLMGIKILLAFVLFTLASGLAGRSKAFEFLRRNAATWLLVVILLGTVVTGIGSFLKVRKFTPTTENAAVEARSSAAPGMMGD